MDAQAIAKVIFEMTLTMSDIETEELKDAEISAITEEIEELQAAHTPLYQALEFIARDKSDKWD